MDDMLEEFGRAAAELAYAAPNIPIVSNVTGEVASADQLCSPGYWVRHVREAVRFLEGVRRLESEGVIRFVEAGPDGVLTALAAAVPQHRAGYRGAAPAAPQGPAEAETALSALGGLYIERRRPGLGILVRRARRADGAVADLPVPASAVLAGHPVTV